MKCLLGVLSQTLNDWSPDCEVWHEMTVRRDTEISSEYPMINSIQANTYSYLKCFADLVYDHQCENGSSSTELQVRTYPSCNKTSD